MIFLMSNHSGIFSNERDLVELVLMRVFGQATMEQFIRMKIALYAKNTAILKTFLMLKKYRLVLTNSVLDSVHVGL